MPRVKRAAASKKTNYASDDEFEMEVEGQPDSGRSSSTAAVRDAEDAREYSEDDQEGEGESREPACHARRRDLTLSVSFCSETEETAHVEREGQEETERESAQGQAAIDGRTASRRLVHE